MLPKIARDERASWTLYVLGLPTAQVKQNNFDTRTILYWNERIRETWVTCRFMKISKMQWNHVQRWLSKDKATPTSLHTKGKASNFSHQRSRQRSIHLQLRSQLQEECQQCSHIRGTPAPSSSSSSTSTTWWNSQHLEDSQQWREGQQEEWQDQQWWRKWSMPAGLRMDGLPALDLWDVVTEVLRSSNSTKTTTNCDWRHLFALPATCPMSNMCMWDCHSHCFSAFRHSCCELFGSRPKT